MRLLENNIGQLVVAVRPLHAQTGLKETELGRKTGQMAPRCYYSNKSPQPGV